MQSRPYVVNAAETIRTSARAAHHRAWALGAAAALAMSFAAVFLALGSAPAEAATQSLGSSGLRYPLLPIPAVPHFAAAPSAAVPSLATAVDTTPHGPTYLMTADQCAACHRAHTGQDTNLLKSAPGPNNLSQSNLCFTCHDGSGATTDVKAQYTNPTANNAANREYYQHAATVATTSHTSSLTDEFGGKDARHSECSDCHNPHEAGGATAEKVGTLGKDSTATSTGVTASGRLAGVSGVSVANGATAGSTPTYTFLPGETPETSIQFEYQLCFKCHSGFTTLLPNTDIPPSRYRLDKGVEFNPANPSFHPVEAPGKNTTPDMTASLAGASPYKQWTLTTGSTIRCVNCHADSTKFNLTTPPSANGDLPVHTSSNPGILLQNYRNRALKPAGEIYADADFALCFMCHANAPFATDGVTEATNFSMHGMHMTGLTKTGGPGTSIDTPGAGSGNALCAECHYRQHSTTFKAGTVTTVGGAKLVTFSPNVSGTRRWSSAGIGSGSCSLTCHGYAHTRSYSP